jgi:hypothetical protein
MYKVYIIFLFCQVKITVYFIIEYQLMIIHTNYLLITDGHFKLNMWKWLLQRPIILSGILFFLCYWLVYTILKVIIK